MVPDRPGRCQRLLLTCPDLPALSNRRHPSGYAVQVADGHVYSLGTCNKKARADSSWWLGPLAECRIHIVEGSTQSPGVMPFTPIGLRPLAQTAIATVVVMFSNGATVNVLTVTGGYEVQSAKVQSVEFNAAAQRLSQQ